MSLRDAGDGRGYGGERIRNAGTFDSYFPWKFVLGGSVVVVSKVCVCEWM